MSVGYYYAAAWLVAGIVMGSFIRSASKKGGVTLKNILTVALFTFTAGIILLSICISLL